MKQPRKDAKIIRDAKAIKRRAIEGVVIAAIILVGAWLLWPVQ